MSSATDETLIDIDILAKIAASSIDDGLREDVVKAIKEARDEAASQKQAAEEMFDKLQAKHTEALAAHGEAKKWEFVAKDAQRARDIFLAENRELRAQLHRTHAPAAERKGGAIG